MEAIDDDPGKAGLGVVGDEASSPPRGRRADSWSGSVIGWLLVLARSAEGWAGLCVLREHLQSAAGVAREEPFRELSGTGMVFGSIPAARAVPMRLAIE